MDRHEQLDVASRGQRTTQDRRVGVGAAGDQVFEGRPIAADGAVRRPGLPGNRQLTVINDHHPRVRVLTIDDLKPDAPGNLAQQRLVPACPEFFEESGGIVGGNRRR
ncbi:MAG TPA: hypothetical protein VJN29_03115 [Intrasporangium sp.]|nr:hypothetical protein [Intrasporangium sp.]HKX66191.1 hypothetical protein [Intrasporangium sp.]